MTVTSPTTKGGPYNGDSATTVFTVPFYFLANADLLVTRKNADGTETVMALTTDYSVSGAGNPAGGSITFVAAPVTGVKITITRNMSLVQGTTYPAAGIFPAATTEQRLDALTMMLQQINEQVQRTITLQVSSSATKPVLADPVATQVLAYDATGANIVSSPVSTFIGPAGPQGPSGSLPIVAAGGTADAITATYTPALTLADKTLCVVVPGADNATTTPTFAPNALTPHTITKRGGAALGIADIKNLWPAILQYNLANTRWELLNPANPVYPMTVDPTTGAAAGFAVTFNNQSGTTYTLAATDAGKTVTLNNASAITVTLPNSLGIGFTCECIQLGAGQVTFSATAQATLNNRSAQSKIAGQHGAIRLSVTANSDGSHAVYNLAGDTA